VKRYTAFLAFTALALGLLGAFQGPPVYDVGPGQPFPTLSSVPWGSLPPGAVVNVHSGTYREKLVISSRGTSDAPITVRCAPGATEKPVIEGTMATTAASMPRLPYLTNEDRGLVVVGRNSTQAYSYKPGYLVIEGLDFRNANPLTSYTTRTGEVRPYASNAAGLWIQCGEHVTVRRCSFTGSGNGFFVSSGAEEALLSRDITLEQSYFANNGNAGSDRHHHSYCAAIGMVYRGNIYGPLREGSLGMALKDRGAGTVIEGNDFRGRFKIACGIEDPEDNRSIALDPAFALTVVEGNWFRNTKGDGAFFLHFGGDTGIYSIYRPYLRFRFNNVVINRDQAELYRLILIRADTNAQRAQVEGNNVWLSPLTPGAKPPELSLLQSAGTVTLGANRFPAGWRAFRSGVVPTGTVTGAENVSGPLLEPSFPVSPTPAPSGTTSPSTPTTGGLQ
jgi:hypothetical protein